MSIRQQSTVRASNPTITKRSRNRQTRHYAETAMRTNECPKLQLWPKSCSFATPPGLKVSAEREPMEEERIVRCDRYPVECAQVGFRSVPPVALGPGAEEGIEIERKWNSKIYAKGRRKCIDDNVLKGRQSNSGRRTVARPCLPPSLCRSWRSESSSTRREGAKDFRHIETLFSLGSLEMHSPARIAETESWIGAPLGRACPRSWPARSAL